MLDGVACPCQYHNTHALAVVKKLTFSYSGNLKKKWRLTDAIPESSYFILSPSNWSREAEILKRTKLQSRGMSSSSVCSAMVISAPLYGCESINRQRYSSVMAGENFLMDYK